MKKTTAWNHSEDVAIVRDYLTQSKRAMSGEKVNKSATLRALLPLLNGRPRGSVEFKRANISAVLVDLGLPALVWPGYRPAVNYQRSLVAAVAEALGADPVKAQAVAEEARRARK